MCQSALVRHIRGRLDVYGELKRWQAMGLVLCRGVCRLVLD